MITSDSGEKTKTDNGYLPGGTLAIFTGKLAGMIVKEKTTKDKFRRWTLIRIEAREWKMQIFNVYRISESTQSGILKSKVQYDRVRGEVKITREYRTEMLRDLSTEINQIKNEGVQGIILTGDMNQDIFSEPMQQFIRENSFYELY